MKKIPTRYIPFIVLAIFLLFAPKAEARALQYVGGTTGSGTNATYAVSLTSLTGGIGTAPIEGDIVIVTTGYAWTANVDLSVDGYTEIADVHGNDSRDAELFVGYKIMTSSPDTSVTVPGSGNAANGGATVVHVWRGVDKDNPIDVAATTAAPNNVGANNADGPANTPVTSGAVIIAAGLSTGDASPLTKTMPSNMEYGRSVTGTGSTMSAYAGIASYHMHQLAAFDPGVWSGGETSASDSYAIATFGLRPQSPGSPLFQAVGTAAAATTGTLTVAWPTIHAVNDIGLLFIESQANEASLTIPNGFQRLGATVSATGTRLDVFWARATSTIMGSPVAAGNSDHAYGVILTFRNVAPSNGPFYDWRSDVKNSASVTDTAPEVATGEEGQLIVVAVTSDADSASAFASAFVNNSIRGITERHDAGTANGNGGGIAIATAIEESATSTTNTTAVTVTSSASAMMTISLKGPGYAQTSSSATQDRINKNGSRWRVIGGRLLFQ